MKIDVAKFEKVEQERKKDKLELQKAARRERLVANLCENFEFLAEKIHALSLKEVHAIVMSSGFFGKYSFDDFKKAWVSAKTKNKDTYKKLKEKWKLPEQKDETPPEQKDETPPVKDENTPAPSQNENQMPQIPAGVQKKNVGMGAVFDDKEINLDAMDIPTKKQNIVSLVRIFEPKIKMVALLSLADFVDFELNGAIVALTRLRNPNEFDFGKNCSILSDFFVEQMSVLNKSLLNSVMRALLLRRVMPRELYALLAGKPIQKLVTDTVRNYADVFIVRG